MSDLSERCARLEQLLKEAPDWSTSHERFSAWRSEVGAALSGASEDAREKRIVALETALRIALALYTDADAESPEGYEKYRHACAVLDGGAPILPEQVSEQAAREEALRLEIDGQWKSALATLSPFGAPVPAIAERDKRIAGAAREEGRREAQDRFVDALNRDFSRVPDSLRSTIEQHYRGEWEEGRRVGLERIAKFFETYNRVTLFAVVEIVSILHKEAASPSTPPTDMGRKEKPND